MIEFFKVDLVGELAKNLKPTSEINQSMLNRIGLQKVNGAWTYKGGDGEGAGSNGVADQEDAKVLDPIAAPMLPFEPPAPREEAISNFEHLVISRLDNMIEKQ